MSKDEIAVLYEFVEELNSKGRSAEVLNDWVGRYPEFKRLLVDAFHEEFRINDMELQKPALGEPSQSLEGVKSTGVSTLLAMLVARDQNKTKRA